MDVIVKYTLHEPVAAWRWRHAAQIHAAQPQLKLPSKRDNKLFV